MEQRDFGAIRARIQQVEVRAPERQEVLLDVIDAIGTSDYDRLQQHFTEDIELVIDGFPEIDGNWRGRDRVINAIAWNFNRIGDQKPEVRGVIHQGDSSALMIEETGKYKSSGVCYQAKGVIWFSFDGARVKRIDEVIHVRML